MRVVADLGTLGTLELGASASAFGGAAAAAARDDDDLEGTGDGDAAATRLIRRAAEHPPSANEFRGEPRFRRSAMPLEILPEPLVERAADINTAPFDTPLQVPQTFGDDMRRVLDMFSD